MACGGWGVEIVAACLTALPCSAQRPSQNNWNSHVDHTPPGNTDLTAAIDDGYAAAIKWHMRVAQEIWLEDDENLDKWEDGKLCAGDRRILITHWLEKAVKVVHENLHALWRYHERTGSIITVDGTRRALLNPGGRRDYDIGIAPADLPTLFDSEVALGAQEPEAVTPEPDIPSDDDCEEQDTGGVGTGVGDNLVTEADADKSDEDDGEGGDAMDEEEEEDDDDDMAGMPTLENILMEGEEVLEVYKPLVMSSVIGFNWAETGGWGRGKLVGLCNSRNRRNDFQWLVLHNGEVNVRPMALKEEDYGATGGAGAWVTIFRSQPLVTETRLRCPEGHAMTRGTRTDVICDVCNEASNDMAGGGVYVSCSTCEIDWCTACAELRERDAEMEEQVRRAAEQDGATVEQLRGWEVICTKYYDADKPETVRKLNAAAHGRMLAEAKAKAEPGFEFRRGLKLHDPVENEHFLLKSSPTHPGSCKYVRCDRSGEPLPEEEREMETKELLAFVRDGHLVFAGLQEAIGDGERDKRERCVTPPRERGDAQEENTKASNSPPRVRRRTEVGTTDGGLEADTAEPMDLEDRQEQPVPLNALRCGQKRCEHCRVAGTIHECNTCKRPTCGNCVLINKGVHEEDYVWCGRCDERRNA